MAGRSRRTTTVETVSFPEFVEIYNSEIKCTDKNFKELPNKLWTPQKHLEVCQWLEDTELDTLRLLMAYRGFSKSHLMGLYPAWRLYKEPDLKIMYVSGTGTVSSKMAYYLRTIIETHPLTKHLVPKGKAKQELWQKTQFQILRPTPDKEMSVVCTSVKGAKTGARPSFIICDDLEVPENVRTSDARELLREVVGELISLTPNILFVGTPHDAETIYHDITDMGASCLKIPFFGLDKTGASYKGIEDGGSVQMPELHDLEWLHARKSLQSTAKFECDYLLIARSSYDVVLDPEMCNTFESEIKIDEISTWMDAFKKRRPDHYINGEQIKDLKSYWDSAFGTANRDASVFAVCASTYEGNVYVVDLVELPAVDASTGFDKQMAKILEACERNGVNTVHVETNVNFTLATELKRFAKKNGKKLRTVGVRRTINKETYIADALEPIIQIGRMYINKKIFRNTNLGKEMRDFPQGKHDDTIDSIAGAINELKVSKVKYNGEPVINEHGVGTAPKVSHVNP